MFVHLTKQTKFLVRVRLSNKRTNTNELPAERFTNNVWFVCSPSYKFNVVCNFFSKHHINLIKLKQTNNNNH
ncbi:hypothetical protein Hanom_Chr01g00002471 [Helianthus anomalus]